MGQKLSHKLLDMGFNLVLGTIQNCGGTHHLVGRGLPNTWDANNGVVVVYDEVGRPWIRRSDYFSASDKFEEFRACVGDLKKGAAVPHSNDGGHYVRDVMPVID